VTQYKSLEELAAEFERRADNADAEAHATSRPKSRKSEGVQAEADLWRSAAVLLRTATFSDLGDPPVFMVEHDVDEAGIRRARYRANGLKAVADHLCELIGKALTDAQRQPDPDRYWRIFGEADGLVKARDIISLVEIEPNLDPLPE
jgi:hypothetical protein